MDVRDKVAVVTGSAGGIGAALAERLLAAGASVVLTDLHAGKLTATTDLLTAAYPGRVAALAGDAADEPIIAGLLSLAADRFGPVDLYAANAGIGGAAGLTATDAEWAATLQINVMAHVRAARLLVPEWLDRGHGYFVSTASAAGLLTQIGSATYSVTKHAAVAFAEWLSITYGSRGIRVSCLCPMGVDTELLRGDSPDGAAFRQAAARAVIEAGPVLQPADVADSVLAAIAQEQFLVLPHPQMRDMWAQKTVEYGRWLGGIRRYQNRVGL